MHLYKSQYIVATIYFYSRLNLRIQMDKTSHIFHAFSLTFKVVYVGGRNNSKAGRASVLLQQVQAQSLAWYMIPQASPGVISGSESQEIPEHWWQKIKYV